VFYLTSPPHAFPKSLDVIHSMIATTAVRRSWRQGHRAFYGPCRDFVQVFGREPQNFKDHVDPGDADRPNDPALPPRTLVQLRAKV
jgi:hypothetical protein